MGLRSWLVRRLRDSKEGGIPVPKVVTAHGKGATAGAIRGYYGAMNVDAANQRTFWAHHAWTASGWRTCLQGLKSRAEIPGTVPLQHLLPPLIRRVIALHFQPLRTLTPVASHSAVLKLDGCYTVGDPPTEIYYIRKISVAKIDMKA